MLQQTEQTDQEGWICAGAITGTIGAGKAGRSYTEKVKVHNQEKNIFKVLNTENCVIASYCSPSLGVSSIL